jgi:hypothetical protein
MQQNAFKSIYRGANSGVEPKNKIISQKDQKQIFFRVVILNMPQLVRVKSF